MTKFGIAMFGHNGNKVPSLVIESKNVIVRYRGAIVDPSALELTFNLEECYDEYLGRRELVGQFAGIDIRVIDGEAYTKEKEKTGITKAQTGIAKRR